MIAEKEIVAMERGWPHCYSEDEIFTKLKNIGVPNHFQIEAFLFLIDSQSKMRAFFGCPGERRRKLLLHIMYGPTAA